MGLFTIEKSKLHIMNLNINKWILIKRYEMDEPSVQLCTLWPGEGGKLCPAFPTKEEL